MTKTIAILEGDGIGPEISAEGVKVLKAIEEKYGHQFKLEYAPFGAAAYFTEGSPFPEETKLVCDKADCIIKGPVGLSINEMEKIPQAMRPENGAILPLRKRYDTYANYRPVILDPSFVEFSPLRPELLSKTGLDILMIRELVGGIYFGDKTEGESTGMSYAADDCRYTKEQIRRVAITAFEEAKKSKTKLLTNVHKSNVLATSRFWKKVSEELIPEYPEVKYSSILVDNVAYQLVVNPAQFNGVMLLENMQGDIITDQAGGVLGSLGLMPSACIGPNKGYVEPAHGSAPDIAGKNIANPYSMIGSVALMLDKFFGLEKESQAIWNAMFDIMREGYRTPDLAPSDLDKSKVLSTTAFGDKVCAKILA